jgi:hypothetical protein
MRNLIIDNPLRVIGEVVKNQNMATCDLRVFYPDNRWLVTGSYDKTARLWPLQLENLIDLARITVGRNFFPNEWQLYFPGKKYRKTFPELPGPD